MSNQQGQPEDSMFCGCLIAFLVAVFLIGVLFYGQSSGNKSGGGGGGGKLALPLPNDLTGRGMNIGGF